MEQATDMVSAVLCHTGVRWVAYCPEFELSVHGVGRDEALEELSSAIQEFLSAAQAEELQQRVGGMMEVAQLGVNLPLRRLLPLASAMAG
jgi:predicted RNase H-like HicB family nuclease